MSNFFLLFRKYFYNYKYENVEKNIKLDIILIINIGGMIGMKIYYVRHGQTDLNLAKKMQGGGTEKELNETGVSQAYNTKKELENVKYDLVICSPMKRAKQTAEIINEGRDIPIITDERIRERKLGDYEGRDVTEEMENNIWDYKLNYNIPNGENLHDFEKRIDEFFDDMDDISDDTLMEDDSALTDLFQQIRDRIRQSVSQTEGDFVPLKDILEKYDRNGMTAAPPANSITQIFSFDSLNTLIYLTGFQNDFKMNSSLYKSPQDNRYYLIMDKSSRKIEDTYEFAEFCTLLAEYGQVEDGYPLRETYYKENFDRLIARKALQKLQQINHTGGLR